MIIEAFSDTHGNRHQNLKLKGADVLICSGDISNYGEYKAVTKFLDWFKKLDGYKHKILIPGNHDLSFEDRPDWLLKELKKLPKNIHYLEHSGIEINKIKFYGCPTTPIFGDWAFMSDDKERVSIYNNIPKDTDVLITHGPPFGILDVNRFGENCGCGYIEEFTKDVKVHIFGHIHEGYGFKEKDNKRYYNVSSFKVFNDSSIVNDPVIIEI